MGMSAPMEKEKITVFLNNQSASAEIPPMNGKDAVAAGIRGKEQQPCPYGVCRIHTGGVKRERDDSGSGRSCGCVQGNRQQVLHKSYSISQETCDRVNAVIKELGYQPNRRAQSFATGATKTILFLAEIQHGVGFDNPHLFEIMAGGRNALSEKGYGLIVQHSTALDLWQHFDELLQGSYVDGVILHASVVSKDVALCLAHTELPYIVVGAPDFSNQLCWIDTNNSVAGQIAVTHLWRNGYDRIAFIGGPKEDTISAHRLSGALATLNEKIPAGYFAGRAAHQ